MPPSSAGESPLVPLLRARRGRSKRQVQGQCWRVGRRMCNRVFLYLQRSCVCCFSVVQRKMLVFPYAVRGRACVVWPADAWVALCKVTAPALCLPARPPDLFALYLLKLWAGGAWERELQSSLKIFFNRVRVGDFPGALRAWKQRSLTPARPFGVGAATQQSCSDFTSG